MSWGAARGSSVAAAARAEDAEEGAEGRAAAAPWSPRRRAKHAAEGAARAAGAAGAAGAASTAPPLSPPKMFLVRSATGRHIADQKLAPSRSAAALAAGIGGAASCALSGGGSSGGVAACSGACVAAKEATSASTRTRSAAACSAAAWCCGSSGASDDARWLRLCSTLWSRSSSRACSASSAAHPLASYLRCSSLACSTASTAPRAATCSTTASHVSLSRTLTSSAPRRCRLCSARWYLAIAPAAASRASCACAPSASARPIARPDFRSVRIACLIGATTPSHSAALHACTSRVCAWSAAISASHASCAVTYCRPLPTGLFSPGGGCLARGGLLPPAVSCSSYLSSSHSPSA
eukprot:scaffold80554_cov61-Phaeocystis_antarctica.AAC.2